MLKTLRNLKESWVSVIIIVLLLIVQATCDLTLPDYTSKIVNVGIQNGGIEEVAPDALRKSTMESLLIFTEDDETILSCYEEISKENFEEKEYEKLKKQYPALENEVLYKIKKLDKEEKENLNTIMAKPLTIISYLQNGEMQEQMQTQMSMPKEQLNSVIAEINKQLDDMQDSILEQAAIQAVKQEYKDMGVNTDNIQNKYIIISGIKMLGISLIIMLSAIIIMLLSAKVGARSIKLF